MTASMVCCQMCTPVLNGGAVEQPIPIKVVTETVTPEEEEEIKCIKKVTP